MRLQNELDELIDKNLGATVAAQRVKKLMHTVWNDLSESEKFGIDTGVRAWLRFLKNVKHQLSEWGYSDPAEVLKSLHPYGTDETLEDIIANKRNKDGDEAAIELLGQIMARLTGDIG